MALITSGKSSSCWAFVTPVRQAFRRDAAPKPLDGERMRRGGGGGREMLSGINNGARVHERQERHRRGEVCLHIDSENPNLCQGCL